MYRFHHQVFVDFRGTLPTASTTCSRAHWSRRTTRFGGDGSPVPILKWCAWCSPVVRGLRDQGLDLVERRTDRDSSFCWAPQCRCGTEEGGAVGPGLPVQRHPRWHRFVVIILTLFLRLNPEQAEQFTERLTTGSGLHRGHSLLMLRDRLLGSEISSQYCMDVKR